MDFNLKGYVNNDSSGVNILLQGEASDIEALLNKLEQNPPILAKIDFIEVVSVNVKEYNSFKITKSDNSLSKTTNISADMAICKDCISDIKNPNNRIDQEFLLPHPIKGNNPKNKVCFIVKDDMEISLKKMGYDIINPKMLDSLQKQSKKDKKAIAKKYDYFVARADLMRNLAKVLARFLGQQGKMPRPQPKGFGVIKPNENIEAYITKLNRIIKISMKKQLIIQLKFGKKSQDFKTLKENLDSVLNFIKNALPNGK